MNNRNYKVTTNEQYCKAINAIMREKGVKFVNFEIKTSNRNPQSKKEIPWCNLFNEFISTVSVPSQMTEKELEKFSDKEKAFIQHYPDCITIAVINKENKLRYELFNGYGRCNWDKKDKDINVNYKFIFNEVYSKLLQDDVKNNQSEIWLDKKGLTIDIDPEKLLEDINLAADIVAEEKGMNIDYCESMDLGEVFPAIAEMAAHPNELKNEEYILDTLRFVSDEHSIFPKEMETASLEQFKEYFDEHYQEILISIREDVDRYLSEYNEEQPIRNEHFQPNECPFCGSQALLPIDDGKVVCVECDIEFAIVDHEFEQARHQISASLSACYATERKPLLLKINLEKRQINGAFHDPEAKVWFLVKGQKEPLNIDEFTLEEVKTIIEQIKK